MVIKWGDRRQMVNRLNRARLNFVREMAAGLAAPIGADRMGINRHEHNNGGVIDDEGASIQEGDRSDKVEAPGPDGPCDRHAKST